MNFANVREAAGAIIKHRCSAGGTATGAERRARSALGGSHGNETPQPGEAGHQGILGSRAVSSASRSGVLYNHAREKDCPTHTHSHTGVLVLQLSREASRSSVWLVGANERN